MKIIITGGHLTPALACIDFIKQHHPDDEIIFIGRKFSQKNTQLAKEKTEIEKRNIQFFSISSPKFLSHRAYLIFLQLPQLLKAILKSLQIIKSQKPDILLSFGGYLSIPVAVAAKFAGLKIVIHEQTNSLGLANKIISLFADKIALSHKNKENNKFIFTGNPLRKALTEKTTKPSWLEDEGKKPLLYVTGGNQGSAIINKLVSQTLDHLLKDFVIVHQVGKNQNSTASKQDYFSRPWISEKELAWILQHADISVSRAGANTTQELQYFAIPTLYIPLASARNNEQLLNAKDVEKFGGAIILEQSKANAQTLLSKLNKLQKNKKSIIKKLQENKPSQALTANKNIYHLLEEALQE